MLGYSRSKPSDTDLQPEMVAHLAAKRQREQADAAAKVQAKADADRKTAERAEKAATADARRLAKAVVDEFESRGW